MLRVQPELLENGVLATEPALSCGHMAEKVDLF